MKPLTRRLLVGAAAVLTAAIVVYVLFTFVFPWVDRTFVNDPVLGTVSLTR